MDRIYVWICILFTMQVYAHENLKKAVDNGYGSKTQFITEPAFEALKPNARFKRLLKKIN